MVSIGLLAPGPAKRCCVKLLGTGYVPLMPHYVTETAAAVQGRRVAQAQAQQQAEITFTESLEVVSCQSSTFCAAPLSSCEPSADCCVCRFDVCYEWCVHFPTAGCL